MQLLIDIGNTRLKWCWARGGEVAPGGAEALPGAGQEKSLFECLWGAAGVPERILVSDVSGDPLRSALGAWSVKHWGREAEFVASTPHFAGVTNGYEVPSTLGVDRWCALIGARTIAAGHLCVVDCGTAMTLDLLSPDGRHEGGLISPGLGTMVRSLTSAARGLRLEVKVAPAAKPLGHNTTECIQAGVLAAAAGMVECTLERLAFPTHGLLLLTGGDAALLGSALQRPFRIEHELVFRGLARIGALR